VWTFAQNGNSYLTGPGPTITDPWSIAVAISFTSLAGSSGYASILTNGGANRGLYTNGGNKIDWYTAADHVSNGVLSTGTWCVIGVSYAGGSGTFYYIGAPAGTFSISWPLTSSYNRIGAQGVSNNLSGSILWLALWGLNLTASQQAVIGSSPNAIWQIFAPQRSVMWSYKAPIVGGSNYWGRSAHRPWSRPVTGPAIPAIYG
jgi:hypothetical protein